MFIYSQNRDRVVEFYGDEYIFFIPRCAEDGNIEEFTLYISPTKEETILLGRFYSLKQVLIEIQDIHSSDDLVYLVSQPYHIKDISEDEFEESLRELGEV